MSVRDEALRIATRHIGVRETSRNSGPEVDAFLASVGLGPGYSWCAAFVYSCFENGAASIQQPNPCPRTAGALHLWDMALADGHLGDSLGKSVKDPLPGDVFVIDHGHGLGHVGFVESILSVVVVGSYYASGPRLRSTGATCASADRPERRPVIHCHPPQDHLPGCCMASNTRQRHQPRPGGVPARGGSHATHAQLDQDVAVSEPCHLAQSGGGARRLLDPGHHYDLILGPHHFTSSSLTTARVAST